MKKKDEENGKHELPFTSEGVNESDKVKKREMKFSDYFEKKFVLSRLVLEKIDPRTFLREPEPGGSISIWNFSSRHSYLRIDPETLISIGSLEQNEKEMESISDHDYCIK